MINRIHRIFFTLGLVGWAGTASAQLQVLTNTNPAQLLGSLWGPGVNAFNVTYTGTNNSAGLFYGLNSSIGLPSGMMLTTGDSYNALGPNNQTSAGTDNGRAGDADLSQMINFVAPTFDACILEFDFVPFGDTIQVNYVFASEEYPEFSGSNFNDVFAFLVSGPGITGTVNIAGVPGTTDPVAINNINNGTGNAGPCVNCLYYQDGTGDTTQQFDGYTVPLTAYYAVTPGDTYHLKLAIADAGDGIFDSAIFLQAMSFRAGNSLLTTTAYPGPEGVSLVEGCHDGSLVLTRTGDLSQGEWVELVWGGNALDGVDYTSLPDSVFFPVGVFQQSVGVEVLTDALTEGGEDLYVVMGDTTHFTLWDPPVANFSFSAGGPSLSVLFAENCVFGGSIQSWFWNFGDGNTSTSANPLHVFGAPGTYTVQLTVTTAEGCQATYSQSVQVLATGVYGGFSPGILEAFPNPSQGDLHLTLGFPRQGNLTANLLDANARSMAHWNFGNVGTGTLDLDFQFPAELANGVYWLDLNLEGKSSRLRVFLNR